MTETVSCKRSPYTWLAIIGLVLLCINPAYTQGEHNKNLLLAVAMTMSPLVLFLRKARVFIPRIDIPLVFVCVSVIVNPLVFHPDTVRWITMLFTCACCVYFMMLARLVRIADLSSPTLYGMIRIIIYAFTIILVIQQICLICGLPVPNEAMVYPQAPWKLNSLTAEPSHTTVTLATLMYFYTQTRRISDPDINLFKEIKSEWLLWLCWGWTLFSTVNASAFLLAPLSLLPYVTHRNIWYCVGAIGILAILLFVTPVGRMGQLDRLRKVICATITLDTDAIEEADSSAAARIAPTIWGAQAIDITEADTWKGHGTDADQRDIKERPCDGLNRGFAGIFSMFYNYGALCAIAFWCLIAIVSLIRHHWISILTFLFAMQMSAEHNMQLIWMILAFSLVFKYNVYGVRSLLYAKK